MVQIAKHPADCRCHFHEDARRGVTVAQHLGNIARLLDVEAYAQDRSGDARLEAAHAAMNEGIAERREPTTCGVHYTACNITDAHGVLLDVRKCFGCPERRVDSRFLPRADW